MNNRFLCHGEKLGCWSHFTVTTAAISRLVMHVSNVLSFYDNPLIVLIITLTVFSVLLFAALLHASWNAIVKAGSNKLYSAISVSGTAAIMVNVQREPY